MPVYEYVCSACSHRTDILHGIDEPGPNFCPGCGAEATMRKAFAAPAIVFKGSGWAKKDRSTSAPRSAPAKESSDGEGSKTDGEGSRTDGEGSRTETARSGESEGSSAPSTGGSSD